MGELAKTFLYFHKDSILEHVYKHQSNEADFKFHVLFSFLKGKEKKQLDIC
jgi:hypothetical protein